jgi:hypothetical protein
MAVSITNGAAEVMPTLQMTAERREGAADDRWTRGGKMSAGRRSNSARPGFAGLAGNFARICSGNDAGTGFATVKGMRSSGGGAIRGSGCWEKLRCHGRHRSRKSMEYHVRGFTVYPPIP